MIKLKAICTDCGHKALIDPINDNLSKWRLMDWCWPMDKEPDDGHFVAWGCPMCP